VGDNGVQRGGFGVPPKKQGKEQPAKRAVKAKKPPKAVVQKPAVKRPAVDPKARKRLEKQQRLNRQMREMERYRKTPNAGCAVTAITIGISLVGAVATLRSWA
jgi:hypothetical protein